jgi:caffeoyl-CoA O-methyltransferase
VRALQRVVARIRRSGPERDIVDPEIFAYAVAHTTAPGDEVAAMRAETDASVAAPQMASGIVESRLLEALVVATRARRVLEIGTFTGVSALSIASRLPDGGMVVTLEADPHVAAIARRHFASSRHGTKIQLIEGDARDAVTTLEGPFELVFIDAWKHDYGHYYDAVLPKLADHGLIVADNVLWRGQVLDARTHDEETIALQAFTQRVQADSRVDNALLTVADGLLLIWKRAGA